MEYQSYKLNRETGPSHLALQIYLLTAGAQLTCRQTHLPIAGADALNISVSAAKINTHRRFILRRKHWNIREKKKKTFLSALGSVFFLSHRSNNTKDVQDSWLWERCWVCVRQLPLKDHYINNRILSWHSKSKCVFVWEWATAAVSKLLQISSVKK